MCGIAGVYNRAGITHPAIMEQMTDAIAHRGPDAAGHYFNPENTLALGHRRLSIIDLSTGANQPIYSADGRYAIIYNGEVYNYQALQAKLPSFAWRTHGDTEVILELFARYGVASFSWLNGMFALAIYDTHSGQLVIARDQIGIKPLYVYQHDGVLLFASEIKAIVASGIADLSIDKTAIPHFLHLGFIPQPQTIYQHIRKFPSGHYAMMDTHTGDMKTHSYWKATDHYHPDTTIDEASAQATYTELLYDAVRTQMISDVPLGTFLSGGIDSSLVTAVASKISNQKVKTFSIGFHEAQYDESNHAKAVADHLGTDHHPFKVKIDDVLELVPDLLHTYDEPYADSSAFPTMLVSRLARQHVTVTLSGDGGDETFQGYGMYEWAKRLDNPWVHTFRQPMYQVSQMMGNRYKRAGTLLNYANKQHIHSHIFSQEQYFFSEKELSGLLTNTSFDFDPINDIHTTTGNAAERQAMWDLGYYLRDDLLVKVDRASMKYSLESRVPLLDTRLIEFSLSLPYSYKVNADYGTKYLMKKVLYELVPRSIFERPKRGFSIPLSKWLKGELRYLIDQYLHPDWVASCGVVQPDAVKGLLTRYEAGEDYLYNRIWVLLLLHWWMKKYQTP